MAILLVLSMTFAAMTPQTPPSLAGPEWRLISLTGHDPAAVAGLKRPVTIVFRDTEVAGSFGCNGFGGTYAVEGDRLVFGALVGTMMACPEPAMSIENAIRKALTGSVPFTRAGNRLTLTTASNVSLVFEARPRKSRAEGVRPK